jgi:hypothetical protein
MGRKSFTTGINDAARWSSLGESSVCTEDRVNGKFFSGGCFPERGRQHIEIYRGGIQ